MIRRSLFLAVAWALSAVIVVGIWILARLHVDERPPAMAYAVVISVLACGGTASPGGAQVVPPEPVEIRWWNEVPFVPTTMHWFIYDQVEKCLDKTGAFSRVRWFKADFMVRAHDFQRIGGIWIPSPRKIVLDKAVINDPTVVSHEVVHDVLGRGNEAHGDPGFERCTIQYIRGPG